MQVLYKSEYKDPKRSEYIGWIVKDINESIENAVYSYLEGEYSKTLEEAKISAVNDISRPNPEFYYVQVTHVDHEITLIKGNKHEDLLCTSNKYI